MNWGGSVDKPVICTYQTEQWAEPEVDRAPQGEIGHRLPRPLLWIEGYNLPKTDTKTGRGLLYILQLLSLTLSLCVSVCVWGFYLQSKNKSTFSNTHQHVSENVETLRSNTHLPLHVNKYTQTQSRSQRSQPKRIIADLRSFFKSLPLHLQQQHQTRQKPERAEAETETNAELTVIMKKCRCI